MELECRTLCKKFSIATSSIFTIYCCLNKKKLLTVFLIVIIIVVVDFIFLFLEAFIFRLWARRYITLIAWVNRPAYRPEIKGSPSMNVEITGALFTLSLCIRILNYQCEEDASDVNIHCRTTITYNLKLFYLLGKDVVPCSSCSKSFSVVSTLIQ